VAARKDTGSKKTPLHQQDTRERWRIFNGTPEHVIERMGDYTSVGDSRTLRSAQLRDAREDQKRRIEAHYSQSGLPFTAPPPFQPVDEVQEDLRMGISRGSHRLRGLVRQSAEAVQVGASRRGLAESVIRGNKEFQTTDSRSGRSRMSPFVAARKVSSSAEGIPWSRTSTPWFMDPVLGEWVREDEAISRAQGLMERGPLAMVMEGRDSVRTVINEVDLPPRQVVSRRMLIEEANAARQEERLQQMGGGVQERSIRMGGGFTYWSNQPVDEARNTPSRPSYSNGLFLYPFSTEQATRMDLIQWQKPINFEPQHPHRARSAPMHRARLGEQRRQLRLAKAKK